MSSNRPTDGGTPTVEACIAWLQQILKTVQTPSALLELANSDAGAAANPSLNAIRMIAPEAADLLSLAGMALFNDGQAARACEFLEHALEIRADDPSILFNLASMYFQSNNMERAAGAYGRLIKYEPENPENHFCLGFASLRSGQTENAERALLATLDLAPTHLGGANNLGALYIEQGRFEDACSILLQAQAHHPDDPNIEQTLTIAALQLGNFEVAIPLLVKAAAINPTDASIQLYLARVYRAVGNYGGAAGAAGAALRLAPNSDEASFLLAESLAGSAKPFGPNDLEFAAQCMQRNKEAGRLLGPLVCAYYESRESVAAILGRAKIDHTPEALSGGEIPLAISALDEPAFRMLIAAHPLCSFPFENALMQIRNYALLHLCGEGEEGDDLGWRAGISMDFLVALGQQNFLTLYVQEESAQERGAVVALITGQIERIAAGGVPDPYSVAVIACYRPLFETEIAEPIMNAADGQLDPALAPLIAQQIYAPRTEREIAATFESLTPIKDDVSIAVREHYEEHPYPSWQDLKPTEAVAYDKSFLWQYPILRGRDIDWPAAAQILVAGCGTGSTVASVAKQFPDADILALDLSRASLAYGARKAKEMGILNATFAQADILELGTLERKFDAIYCTGVLHHLREPVVGWRNLVDLLKPGGLMRIALYSEIGRAGVVAAREIIAEQGYGANADDIRACRALISTMTDKDRLAEVMRTVDFFNLATCRDMLFHFQEHRFDLPAIKTILSQLDLEFLGFVDLQEATVKSFAEIYPGTEAQRSLDNWHQFEQENPQAFFACYNFWTHKPKRA
ncbi:MAG: tetratricopeptide repeat protein [Rhodospirillales bacterium]|nr:tetratricopeptide repeat protein [Rhodospirillales bacterium]